MWQSSNRRQEAVTHRPPRKPFVPGLRTASTTDHNGENVPIAWLARKEYEQYTQQFPPFPYQIYILTSAKGTLQDPEFATKFADWIENSADLTEPTPDAHCEFYSAGFHNILACTAHQRKEIESRNRNAIWPRLVSSWNTNRDWGYRGFILVIDRDHYETNGLIVVYFDANDLQNPNAFYLPGGDETELWAERMYDPSQLQGSIDTAWRDVGHVWAQSDLDRYNSGQGSPALYPAVDPSAHYDAEHEDMNDLDESSTSSSASDDESAETEVPKPTKQEVVIEDLLKSSQDLEGLKKTTYQGHAGWETTSVWKASLSKTRPPFAFTLYISSDLIPLAAEALFTCLDRDLLGERAWTLDIIRNVPNMESAQHHYSHEKRYRTVEKTEKRLKCSRMLLDRICAPWLPEELLQLIEDMLVPPACPNYSAPPHRVFHDMFLFLDVSTRISGPRIVYSNHVLEDIDPDFQRRRRPRDPVLKMHVTDLKSWRLVRDEVHIVWSLCSPRLKEAPTELPCFSARLNFPEICALQPRRRYNTNDEDNAWPEKAEVRLKLTEASGPITWHDNWTFDDEFWYEGLEIREAENDTVLDAPPTPLNNIPDQRTSSWSEAKDLRSKDLPHDGYRSVLMSMSTRQKGQLRLYGCSAWWLSLYDEGSLKDGCEYIVSIKKGFGVKRWTYGTVPGLKGPYNLPPIPVHGENECRFKVVVENPRTAGEVRRQPSSDNSDDSDDSDESDLDMSI